VLDASGTINHSWNVYFIFWTLSRHVADCSYTDINGIPGIHKLHKHTHRRWTSIEINLCKSFRYYLFWRRSPTRATASTFKTFLDHTQRRATVCRNPLDEWSAAMQRPLPDTHTELTTDRILFQPDGIRTRNPSTRAVGGLRLRPRGHWDRLNY